MSQKYYKVEVYLWNKNLWITDGGAFYSKVEAKRLKDMIELRNPSASCSIIEEEFNTIDYGLAALLRRIDDVSDNGVQITPGRTGNEAEAGDHAGWKPTVLTKSIWHDTLKLYNSKNIYDIGIRMLDRHTENVILCQMTSTPILGANNFNFSEGLFYSKLINRIKSGNNVIHGFVVDKTRLDMRAEHYDLKSAKNNLLQMGDDYRNNNYFKFFKLDPAEDSTSYLITDSEALWIHTIGGSRYYLYNINIPKSDIRKIIYSLYARTKMSFEEILRLYPEAV